jgi:hypothetical protein
LTHIGQDTFATKEHNLSLIIHQTKEFARWPGRPRCREAPCASDRSALTFCFFLVKQKESERLLNAITLFERKFSDISSSQTHLSPKEELFPKKRIIPKNIVIFCILFPLVTFNSY